MGLAETREYLKIKNIYKLSNRLKCIKIKNDATNEIQSIKKV